MVNQGEYRGLMGIVDDYADIDVIILDGNGGSLILPEHQLDNITRSEFKRLLIVMYNEVFNKDKGGN